MPKTIHTFHSAHGKVHFHCSFPENFRGKVALYTMLCRQGKYVKGDKYSTTFSGRAKKKRSCRVAKAEKMLNLDTVTSDAKVPLCTRI